MPAKQIAILARISSCMNYVPSSRQCELFTLQCGVISAILQSTIFMSGSSAVLRKNIINEKPLRIYLYIIFIADCTTRDYEPVSTDSV